MTHQQACRLLSTTKMPSNPRPMCSDCPKQVVEGSRWCTDHQAFNQAMDNRRTADQWRLANDVLRPLYSLARWARLRVRVLLRDPLCLVCGNHASSIVDHVIPAHRYAAEHNGDIEAFYDETNLQGLCKVCHDAKTRRGE